MAERYSGRLVVWHNAHACICYRPNSMYYHVGLILNTLIFCSCIDACATARGLLKQLQTTEAYFRCVVSHRLFATTDAFATAIQRPTINLAEVLRHKGRMLHELQVFRDQFDVIFDTAVSDAKLMDLDELQLPRKRRLPAKLEYWTRGEGTTFTSLMFDRVVMHSSTKQWIPSFQQFAGVWTNSPCNLPQPLNSFLSMLLTVLTWMMNC